MSSSPSHFMPRALVVASLAFTTTCIGYRTPLDDGGVVDETRDAVPDRIVPCLGGTFTLSRAQPTVMFLLDRSSSMETHMAGGSTGPSRWSALASALASVLPPIDDTVAIGAMMFPSAFGGDGNCFVDTKPDLAPATGNVAAMSRLMNAVLPIGSTPTDAAINNAAQLLLGMRTASSARALVLATDGGPGCNPDLDPTTCGCMVDPVCRDVLQCLDDTRTIKTIASYKARGLPTYVLGIESPGDPGYVDFAEVLDAMAVAGGRALPPGGRRYYRTTSAADLDKALTEIRNQVGTCTYLTSSVPSAKGSIVVKIDGTQVASDQWEWGDRSNGELYFVGSACQTLADKTAPAITANVACSDG